MSDLPDELIAGTQAAEELQRAIDAALQQLGRGLVHRIVLDHGSEVSDLSRAVDVQVSKQPGDRHVDVGVISLAFLQEILATPDWLGRKELDGTCVRGDRWFVVDRITGEKVVAGVVRLIELNRW